MRGRLALLYACAALALAESPRFTRRDIATLGAERIAGCAVNGDRLATWGDSARAS